MSILNTDPRTTRSICLGVETAVVLLIEFSNLTSVRLCRPALRRSSSFARLISEKSNLLGVTLPFFAVPKSLASSGQSLSGISTVGFISLARRERILPLRELPGIMGRLVLLSLITGESTVPMAAKADEPPICIPVSTKMLPVICILVSIVSSSLINPCHHCIDGTQPGLLNSDKIEYISSYHSQLVLCNLKAPLLQRNA